MSRNLTAIPGGGKEIADAERELAEAEAAAAECAFAKDAIAADEQYGGRVGITKRICIDPACSVHCKLVEENQEIYGNRKSTTDPKAEAEKARRELEHRIDRLTRRRAWEAIQHGLDCPEADFYVLQIAAHSMVHVANIDFCKAFGLEVAKGEWAQGVMKKWLNEATQEDLIRFIVLAGLARIGLDEYFRQDNGRGDDWNMFTKTAELFDVDLKAIRKQVTAELKKAKAPKKAAAKKVAKQTKRDSKRAAANDIDDDKCDGCGGPLDRSNLCPKCDMQGDDE